MIPFSQGIAYLHLNLHELPCIHTVMNQSYNLNEFNHFFLKIVTLNVRTNENADQV